MLVSSRLRLRAVPTSELKQRGDPYLCGKEHIGIPAGGEGDDS